jgi:hypothetical protein
MFVLIDGYTLFIQTTSEVIAFWGRHSRQSDSAFNDSWMVQVLAIQTLNSQTYPEFWRCLNQHKPCRVMAYDSFGRSYQTELLPITIADADEYQDWSLWELVHRHAESSEQMIWRWVPGDYHPDYYMQHSTVLKIVQVARSWVEHQQIPSIAGVELIDEVQWQKRFNPSGSNPPSNNKFSDVRSTQTSLLIPPILRDLERRASEYLQLFADRARCYTPDAATYLRRELLHRFNLAGLSDRPLDQWEQLMDYPQLQRCLGLLDRLYQKMNYALKDFGKSPLVLDWVLLEEIYPSVDDNVLLLGLQTLQQSTPLSLTLTVNDQMYRLLTVQEPTSPSQIKLAGAIPLRSPQNPTELFADVYNPSYLELLAWAALPDYLPPIEQWHLAIDWAGREQDLVQLGSDGALPQAQQLVGYLVCHLGNLWAIGDRNAFDQVVQLLPQNTEVWQTLRSRCCLLRSGQLKFNYADWFGECCHTKSISNC